MMDELEGSQGGGVEVGRKGKEGERKTKGRRKGRKKEEKLALFRLFVLW